MTGTRAVIAAVGVALVLGVAACSGDDPEPRVAPPSSSPPSTSAASGPIAPTMPPEAKGTDAAAAEAFVKFYWEMVNYAQESGDVSGLAALATDDCVACRAGVRSLRRIFDGDGEVIGGEGNVTVQETNFLAGSGARNAVVEFKVASTKQTIDYPGTGRDRVVPGGTVFLRAVLDPDDGGWAMSYWGEQ